ncbi:MAG: 2OG-Fe(II) oxygenase [Spirosomataceae bacterium]
MTTPFEQLATDLTDQGYAVYDHFLTPDQVQLLRQRLSQRYSEGDFKQAGIGSATEQQVAQQIRGDQIVWLDDATPDPAEQLFLEQVSALSQYLNRRCFLGIRGREFHFAKYPVGTFYKRHLDAFQRKKGRILSVICYLNEDWQPNDGGELAIYLPQADGSETTLRILPIAGRVVCFESDKLEHEVLPTQRERLSVTGWLLDR